MAAQVARPSSDESKLAERWFYIGLAVAGTAAITALVLKLPSHPPRSNREGQLRVRARIWPERRFCTYTF